MDSEDEAEAMAKQMGFSSFGTQGPSKKRKFNPKTDAMVEGQDPASLDKGGKKGQGSGGNKIPLGKPRVFGVAPARKQESEVEVNENKEHASSLPPPSKQEDSEEGEGPAYIDTSLPPPIEEIEAAQQKTDAIITNSTVPPVPPDFKAKIKPPVSETGQRVGHFLSAQQVGILHPIPSVSGASTGGSFIGSHQPRERGQKNKFWYIGYYDPSFNENPWAKLERANGLESRETWVEKVRQNA